MKPDTEILTNNAKKTRNNRINHESVTVWGKNNDINTKNQMFCKIFLITGTIKRYRGSGVVEIASL